MIDDVLRWDRYYDVAPATPTDIADLEATVGYGFADDHRRLLLEHQGMAPDPNGASYIRVHEHRRPVYLGALTPVMSSPAGHSVASLTIAARKSGYPKDLVPVAESLGSQKHFALDYVITPARPQVVYVNSQAPRNDEELMHWASGADPLVRVYPSTPIPGDPHWSVFVVAESLAEMMEKLENDR